MAIYELTENQIVRLPETTFSGEGVREREKLQRLLRANIEYVSDDTMILAEEFGEWDDSRRRIDLLGLDKDANLVVIELKRTDDGGHMELQAIRYAAMVSNMTFDDAVNAHSKYLARHGVADNSRESILQFLGWSEPDEDKFAQDVRIVLVAADFAKELTTAVMWLNNYGLDIRCVRLKPYRLPPGDNGSSSRLMLDVQPLIPLPEAAEYQVQVREKAQKERRAKSGADRTRYTVHAIGESYPNQAKRRGILLVVKTLVEKGRVTPEQVSEVTGLDNLWITRTELLSPHDGNGKGFYANEWFVADADIIRSNGKEYAFRGNIWNSHQFQTVMHSLQEAFPQHGIRFEAVSD